MSIAHENRINELERQVKRLTDQVEELNKMLRPVDRTLHKPNKQQERRG